METFGKLFFQKKVFGKKSRKPILPKNPKELLRVIERFLQTENRLQKS